MADKPAVLNVIDRYGERATIPLTEWARAQERGYQLESGASIVESQRAEKYDQPLQAGLEGAARGLTFGLSDLGAGEDVAARRQYNPVAAGVGEIGGGIAGLGVTGIGGAAARAGEALVGGGTGILSRAAAAAVRTGIEGAALGTGAGISDVLLSKDPMTAEAIAGTLGHHIIVGGLTGAAAGGTLSLAGAGLGAAIRGAGKVVTRAVGRLQAELAGDILPEIPGEPILGYSAAADAGAAASAPRRATEEAIASVRAATDGRLAAMGEGERKSLAELAGALVQRKPVEIAPGTQAALEQLSFTNPTQAGTLFRGTALAEDELARLKPGSTFTFKYNAPSTFNDDLASMYAEEAMGGKVVHARPGGVDGRVPVMFRLVDVDRGYSMVSDNLSKGLDEVLIPQGSRFRVTGRSVDGGVNMIDLRQTGSAPATPASALSVARKAELSSLEAVRGQQGAALAKDLETFRYDVRADLMKLKQELPKGTGLWAEAIAPEKQLHKVIGDLKTLAEEPTLALQPLRRMEQQVAKIGERLPQGTVRPILDRLQSLQDRISDLAGEPTSARLEAIDAHLGSMAGGPKPTPGIDAVVHSAAATAGAVVGHATGIPFAGMAGAWLGKEIGAEVLKPLMKKVLGVFADHAGAIDDGAAKLLAKLTPPAPALGALRQLATAAGVEGENDYEKATNAVQQAAANPEQTREHIRQELAGLAAISPQLAQAVGQQLELKLTFLSSKVPPALTMGITGRVIPPSDSDRSTFARYVAAANDPLRLLQELRAGTLMPETVETHQALYPGITARTQAALTEQLADPKVAGKLSYPMRLQLGMLLGPQVDPTLDPGFIAMLQAPFAAPPPKPSPPAGGRAQAEPPTSAQRLTSQ